MKTIKYQALLTLAVIGLSVQANYASDSLSPSGYLNASAGSELGTTYLANVAPSPVMTVASSPVENLLNSVSTPILNTPSQGYAAAVSSGFQDNNPAGAAPQVIPEPTTLALAGFGGLTALAFLRKFGKVGRG